MAKKTPNIVSKNIRSSTLAILMLIVVGGFMRFYNSNWDLGNIFHPDERNIDAAVSRVRFFDQLNPKFFAYGGLPVYAYRAAGEVVASITKDPSWTSNWGKINVVGRSFSALFSTLTILLVYQLTKKVFDKELALYAAIITTFSASLIQTAHYAITENFLAFSALFVVFVSIKFFEKPNFKNYLKSGVVWGLAIAAKTTALSLGLIPLTAHLLVMAKRVRNIKIFLKTGLLLTLLGVTAMATFLLFSPYTILSWSKFMEAMRYEWGVATGNLNVVYTLQFTKTLPYLYQIKNWLYQVGPIAFLSIPAVVILTIVMIKRKNAKILILLVFPVVYFAYAGSWHTKFVRFMVPILPFIIIFASYLLFTIKARSKLIGESLTLLFALPTIIWGLAFFSVYTKEQTRITASKWIYQNIPAGSSIYTEHWDDGLPIHFPTLNPSNTDLSLEQLTIYEPDNEEKTRIFCASSTSGGLHYYQQPKTLRHLNLPP